MVFNVSVKVTAMPIRRKIKAIYKCLEIDWEPEFDALDDADLLKKVHQRCADLMEVLDKVVTSALEFEKLSNPKQGERVERGSRG